MKHAAEVAGPSKLTVRPRKNPSAGKLKHVRIEMAANGGASVHTQHHGTEQDPYPPEQQMGSYTTAPEAFHHAAKAAGVDSELEEGQEGAAQ